MKLQTVATCPLRGQELFMADAKTTGPLSSFDVSIVEQLSGRLPTRGLLDRFAASIHARINKGTY